MDCKEFDLNGLLSVTAIPVSDYSPGTHAWQVSPTIPSTEFSPTLTNAIVIGAFPATTGGKLVPIMRGTGKVKDDESDSVAGRKHTVTVSCEADDRDKTTWGYLTALERTPCHLLLTFRGGARAFVTATQDTYACEVNREDAKTSVSFKIDDLMGLQLITV